jgi:L-fuconolactonase
MEPEQNSLSNESHGTYLNRRAFLFLAAGMVRMKMDARAASMPIIDTHIHIFDTGRPGGVPWPSKEDTILYRPALPARYRKIAEAVGVTGAVVVEASPLLEDNQWVLEMARDNTIIVGTVGNLEPGNPGFGKHLDRFQRNPLFLGIRYGYLWDRNLGKDLSKPEFISDLKFLAGAGLQLDTYVPDPALMSDVVRLTEKVPTLRVVIDHLPELDFPAESRALSAFLANLQELGSRPQVYVKLSAFLRRVDGRVPKDLSFYRAKLEELWDIFGENRLLYGSDWPNSDLWVGYAEQLDVLRQYFIAKGTIIAEKFFWRNSVAAYRWQKREATQPEPDRV